MFDLLALGIGSLVGLLVGILVTYLWSLRKVGAFQTQMLNSKLLWLRRKTKSNR